MAVRGLSAATAGTDGGSGTGWEDPSWVEAGPFRAHVRHLMGVGGLDAAEVAVVLGLSTRAVLTLLHGRAGRTVRRISPPTARRVLQVSAAEVADLRWCLTPAPAAAEARERLLATGWSDAELARAAGVTLAELTTLPQRSRCNRLLAVRVLCLARRLPATTDERHLAPAA